MISSALGPVLGHTPLREEWIQHLTPLAEQAKVYGLHFVLDLPTGTALRLLEAASPVQVRRMLVLTGSASPEYLDDLWDLGVGLLAVNVADLQTLQLLLAQVIQESRVRWAAPSSALTPGERRLLHLLARGYTNKQLAATLHLSERTVQNTLTRIFEKLGVSSRLEAGLRYWNCPVQEEAPTGPE